MSATRANREKGQQIKEHIKSLIATENKELPLSDAKIAKHLQKLGIDTNVGIVTYHRRMMGFDGFWLRRKTEDQIVQHPDAPFPTENK